MNRLNNAKTTSVTSEVDSLFEGILNSDGENIEYFQNNLDLIINKVENNPSLMKDETYKLYVAQSIIDFYVGNYSNSCENIKQAEYSLNDGKMQFRYKDAKDKILVAIQESREERRVQLKVYQAKQSFLGSFMYGIGLLVLGGIVSGITYSLAEPGGTYLVTSGIFLVGGIYLCISIFRFFIGYSLKQLRNNILVLIISITHAKNNKKQSENCSKCHYGGVAGDYAPVRWFTS